MLGADAVAGALDEAGVEGGVRGVVEAEVHVLVGLIMAPILVLRTKDVTTATTGSS
jgi:hypothetical protein